MIVDRRDALSRCVLAVTVFAEHLNGILSRGPRAARRYYAHTDRKVCAIIMVMISRAYAPHFTRAGKNGMTQGGWKTGRADQVEPEMDEEMPRLRDRVR